MKHDAAVEAALAAAGAVVVDGHGASIEATAAAIAAASAAAATDAGEYGSLVICFIEQENSCLHLN